jgi:hypothetical protein
VAVLVLLDQPASEAPVPASRTAEPALSQQRPDARSALPSPADVTAQRWHGGPAAWGGVGRGSVGEASSGVVGLGLWLRWSVFHAHVSGAWLGSREERRGDGSLRLSVVAVRSAACLDFLARRRLSLAGCATGSLARLSAAGTGYYEAVTVYRPWWLAGAGAAARFRILPRGWVGADIGGFFALNEEVFTVRGLGPVFRTAAAGALAELSVGAELW